MISLLFVTARGLFPMQGALGTYDLLADALLLFGRDEHARVTEPVRCTGLDDPKLAELLPAPALKRLRDEVDMVRGLTPSFDL